MLNQMVSAEKGKKIASCDKILTVCVPLHNRKSVNVLNTLKVLHQWHLCSMRIFRKIHYTAIMNLRIRNSLS